MLWIVLMLKLHLAGLFCSAYNSSRQLKIGRCETINRSCFACRYIVLLTTVSFVRVQHLAVFHLTGPRDPICRHCWVELVKIPLIAKEAAFNGITDASLKCSTTQAVYPYWRHCIIVMVLFNISALNISDRIPFATHVRPEPCWQFCCYIFNTALTTVT